LGGLKELGRRRGNGSGGARGCSLPTSPLIWGGGGFWGVGEDRGGGGHKKEGWEG